VDVFDLRQRLVDDYADYTRSFVVIRDPGASSGWPAVMETAAVPLRKPAGLSCAPAGAPVLTWLDRSVVVVLLGGPSTRSRRDREDLPNPGGALADVRQSCASAGYK
jgi:hypothetical protein